MKRTWLKYVKLLTVAVLTASILNGCSESVDGPVAEGSPTEEQTSEAIEEHATEGTEESVAEAKEEPTEESSEEFQETFVTVDLVAVGDNLIHTGLYKTGMNDSGEWNYDHLYENVKDEIEAADIAIINQETIFIEDRSKISAYPIFGSPPEVLHASNHTVDKGAEGVWDTLNFWKEQHPEVTVLGINESEEDQNTVDVVECNGIRFAMLNYTYGLNGLPMPKEEPYLVNLLDKEKMTADIAQAKEISDMVVVFLHVGDEYVYEPSAYAKEWVDFLLEQGVDIAINAHPHVVEPYTVLTREDGHEMLVYYSVGNFISTQDRVPRLLGGMAKITVQMHIHEEGTDFSIIDYTMEPLVAHWNYGTMEFGVYMLEDYTNELAAKHGIRKVDSSEFSVEVLWDLFEEVTGKAR